MPQVTTLFLKKEREDKIIYLADLMDVKTGLATAPPVTEQSLYTRLDANVIKPWILSTFRFEEETVEEVQKERIIPMHDSIIADVNVMPNEVLNALGAIEPGLLRAKKERLKTHEFQVLNNLQACLKDVFPDCSFYDMTGKARMRMSRHPIPDSSHFSVTEEKFTLRGWVIRHLKFRTQTTNDSAQDLARELCPNDDEEQILNIAETVNTVWNQDTIDKLVHQGVRPKLVSIDSKHEVQTPAALIPKYICTFQHPSGALVPKITMDSSLMCVLYPKPVQEYDAAHPLNP